jgi:hypothetical protein
MIFTPPASGSTRLSPDVWALICSHAEHNGNSSPREALEQLVRQSLGNAMQSCLNAPTAATQPTAKPIGNAAAALDALLLE